MGIVHVEPGSGGDATEQLAVVAGLEGVRQLIGDTDLAVGALFHDGPVAVHVQFAIACATK